MELSSDKVYGTECTLLTRSSKPENNVVQQTLHFGASKVFRDLDLEGLSASKRRTKMKSLCVRHARAEYVCCLGCTLLAHEEAFGGLLYKVVQ